MWRKLICILSITCYILLSYGQPIFANKVKGKKLFAYVGGVGELLKINMETYKIIKDLALPGGEHNELDIVIGLQMSPDGGKIYATGDKFSAPIIVIDSKKLEIIKRTSGEGFEDARTESGYGCGGKLSPDGRRIALVCQFGPAPFALIDTATLKLINKRREFYTDPLHQVIFSDDNKLLYVLPRYQEKQGKTIYETKIIILDAETGEILKEIPLPELKKIKCNTNISAFTGEKSNIYITCNYDLSYGYVRGLFKESVVYPFIETRKSKVIKLIEVKTGKIINEIPMPDGRGELSQITLTPDGRKLLVGRGGYRDSGELTVMDVRSKKVIKRIMLDEGEGMSNVVFGYE